MTYKLSDLAEDVHALLSQSDASKCTYELCELVSKALNDPEFISDNLLERVDREKPREVLYENDELGFCICGHVYSDQAIGKPHDHGSSWALYGQAEGTTEMTDWRIVKVGKDEEPSIVEPNTTYIMKPGDVRFYGIGDVHSPKRIAPTKLIRIEGANLDRIKRSRIIAA